MPNFWQALKPKRDPDSKKVVLPSWLISCLVHGLVYVTVAVSMRSWGNGVPGPGKGGSREVGIFINDSTEGDAPGAVGTGNSDEPGAAPGPIGSVTDASTAPSEAEIANAVGESLNAVVGSRPDFSTASLASTTGGGVSASETGSFALPPSVGTTGLLNGLRNNGIGGVTGTPGGGGGNGGAGGNGNGGTGGGGLSAGGPGGTTFFDVSASGSRFVYVIDHSGSMGFYGQLRVAKNELLASLQSLEATHQFHIVFYDDNLREFRIRDGKPCLNWATDINKTLARQFLLEVQPDGGTHHLAALEKGLSYRPEHLFFLTDADDPILSAADRAKIKRNNAGKTRIHCIEFGKGGDLGTTNFLKQMATENGGTYRYRDISKFSSN